MTSFKNVRAISLDITGTIYRFRYDISATYIQTAQACGLSHTIPLNIISTAFKEGFKTAMIEYPVYGCNQISERDWWKRVVDMTFRRALSHLQLHSKDESDNESDLYQDTDLDFERCFRMIYQHFGSPDAYEIYPDAMNFLQYNKSHVMPTKSKRKITISKPSIIGITTNSPHRTIESTIPCLGLHNHFQFFVSCKDVGVMKPNPILWEYVFKTVQSRIPNIKRNEILHIGDDVISDYCGARSAGFQALHLQRDIDSVDISSILRTFQAGPHYDGKNDDDFNRHTIASFDDINVQVFPSKDYI